MYLLDPGTQAVCLYRLGNWLHRRGIPLLPRVVERTNQFLTGAFIASSATIGERFNIKHSVGIVIGPTAVIGNDVVVLHGVTIGSVDFEFQGKRHATIQDGALIGAHAVLLGDILIGKDARIGAGAVVLQDVPSGAIVVGPEARVIQNAEPGPCD